MRIRVRRSACGTRFLVGAAIFVFPVPASADAATRADLSTTVEVEALPSGATPPVDADAGCATSTDLSSSGDKGLLVSISTQKEGGGDGGGVSGHVSSADGVEGGVSVRESGRS